MKRLHAAVPVVPVLTAVLAILFSFSCVASVQNGQPSDQTGTPSTGASSTAPGNASPSASPTTSPTASGSESSTNPDDSDDSWAIRIIGSAGDEVRSFTERDLTSLIPEQGRFKHVYSTINNWPVSRFYAASGYSIIVILRAVDLLDTAQTVTFRAADGYEISLTRG